MFAFPRAIRGRVTEKITMRGTAKLEARKDYFIPNILYRPTAKR